jgi:hypothetical protein
MKDRVDGGPKNCAEVRKPGDRTTRDGLYQVGDRQTESQKVMIREAAVSGQQAAVSR